MDENPDWLSRIAAAYDRTVSEYHQGIDPLDTLPDKLRRSDRLAALLEDAACCNSGAPANREFLKPQPGMRFLDVGCSASLVNYGLASWPSVYYGVDVSTALIAAMKNFVADQHISIGQLEVADLAHLPFREHFFDLAAVIGVLEYCPFDYVTGGLAELNRVLKRGARVVLDIPNPTSAHLDTMVQLEQQLGRAVIVHSRSKIEPLLEQLFTIRAVDDSHVMLQYFLER
jgi:ubiquinone/menaquinone biosynthesis C-methylase UbiE